MGDQMRYDTGDFWTKVFHRSHLQGPSSGLGVLVAGPWFSLTVVGDVDMQSHREMCCRLQRGYLWLPLMLLIGITDHLSHQGSPCKLSSACSVGIWDYYSSDENPSMIVKIFCY